jgi:hypothetical protein
MEKLFEDLISFRKSKGKDLRESSIKSYKSSLNRIIKLLKGDEYIFENLDIFKDHELIFDKIKDLSITLKKNIITSIMVVLLEKEEYKELKTIYYKYKRGLEGKLKTKYKEQYKTQKESENWLEYKKLIKIVNKYKSEFTEMNKYYKNQIKNGKIIKYILLPEEDNTNIMKMNKINEKKILYHLILQLYCGDPFNHPPRRSVYATFNIVSDDIYKTLENRDNLNLLIIKNKKEKIFQFADYKTSAYHEKAVIINLSKKMNKVINDVMPYLLLYNGGEYNNKWYKTSYNIPLIRNINTGKKAERYSMTKLIHNIFKQTGFNITINSLRKIVITEFYKEVRTKEEKERFALLCGHSYTTGENIYNKMCN